MQALSYETKAKKRPANDGAVELRPRNAMMDKLVKHVSTSPKYSFETVCKTFGGALEKSKTKT
jgi:hypothetical protein